MAGDTIFDQRGQTVTYQYNAAGDIDFGAVAGRTDLTEQLERLRAEVDRAVRQGVGDPETGARVRQRVAAAAAESAQPHPNRERLLGLLGEARALLGGVAAAGGLVSALAAAAAAVGRLL